MELTTDTGNMIKVAGTRLSAQQVAAFTTYIGLMDVKDVAYSLGMETSQLRRWMNAPWWVELERQHMDTSFRYASLKAAHLVEKKVLPFLEEAMEEEDLSKDEIALLNAKQSVSKLIMSIGGSPLIASGKAAATPQVKVTVNNQVNASLDVEKMRELTPEQKHQIAIGGAIPTNCTIEHNDT